MLIKVSKNNERLLKSKKTTQGVSPTWFVNELISKSLSFDAEIADKDSCVTGFLEAVNIMGVDKSKWKALNTLYDDFVTSAYNECHFLSFAEFKNILTAYLKANDFDVRYNKPMTSFMIMHIADQAQDDFKPEERIIEWMSRYITPEQVIMNAKFLDDLRESVMGTYDIGHKQAKRYKLHWAASRGYRIVKGKVNSGRWTKFIPVDKPKKKSDWVFED